MTGTPSIFAKNFWTMVNVASSRNTRWIKATNAFSRLVAVGTYFGESGLFFALFEVNSACFWRRNSANLASILPFWTIKNKKNISLIKWMTEIFICSLFFFLNSGLWHGHFRNLIDYTKFYSFMRSQKIITFYFPIYPFKVWPSFDVLRYLMVT